jgi:hypothetical protein
MQPEPLFISSPDSRCSNSIQGNSVFEKSIMAAATWLDRSSRANPREIHSAGHYLIGETWP